MTVAEPEITDATPAHTPVGMPEPRPSAVLDSAHLGDIELRETGIVQAHG